MNRGDFLRRSLGVAAALALPIRAKTAAPPVHLVISKNGTEERVYANGRLVSFAVFPRALTASQIARHYNALGV